MSQFKTGAKVKNKLTGETAIVAGTREIWVSGRGYIVKIVVKDGDASRTGQEKIWVPTSLEIIEDALPRSVVRYNGIVKEVQAIIKSDPKRVKILMPDLNLYCTRLKSEIGQKDFEDNSMEFYETFAIDIVLVLSYELELINQDCLRSILIDLVNICFKK